jgi:ThiF family
MSSTLVDRSDDLEKLVAEGYDLEIRDTNLLVHHVPYVNADGGVGRCILVSELTTNGVRTTAPGRHEVWVVGGVPYDHQGNKVSFIADEQTLEFGPGLVASCRLSAKRHGQMPADYYIKLSTYVDILGRYARAVDPSATHTDFPARETSEEESVFRYLDAATSRSGLSAVTRKLEDSVIGIVGLGGTGSYILDLVAKTPAKEIHLYDDDVFLAHNAFRAPGAASLEDLKTEPFKVNYFHARYDVMRRSIIPHATRVTEENVDELREMTFVFVAMDAGPDKRVLLERLQSWATPFIDCGMGLTRHDNSLRGTVRVTTGMPDDYDHVERRVSFQDVNEDEYSWNLQTADLNMLNASMAVLRWKKLMGFYVDGKRELNGTYTIASNQLISGEISE